METKIMKIGAEEAKLLLSLNRHNRNLRQTHVQRLAADMANGDWLDGGVLMVAGDPWANDKDAALLDGQHRLAAVVKSNVTIEMVIIFGLALGDQDAVDTGLKRNLADVLALRGEKNSSQLATAVGWYWRRRNNNMRNSQTPTIAQGLAVLRENPDLRECMAPTRRACDLLRISRGMAACIYYEQLAIDAEDTAAFWDTLTTGLQAESNQIHLLRMRFEENAKASYKKLDVVAMAALIIKAWNYWREGKEISQLVWRRGGSAAEPFPELS